jgi:hypothetical protein
MTDKKQPGTPPSDGEISLQYAINTHEELPITLKAGQTHLAHANGA